MPRPESETHSRQGFPAAKDLVSEFLFSQAGNRADSGGNIPGEAYSIDFLIATVPDPISSRLPYFFDSFIDSIESAVEAAGYALDRFALPWVQKGSEGGSTLSPQRSLYESTPGLILFRNPRDHKLLLVFLVGETPTTGIHKRAMFSALDQMAQFYPWDPSHASLPPEFPKTTIRSPADTFKVMGPSFSGSAVSLRFVLDSWIDSRNNPSNLRFEIISGTATAIDASRLSQAGHGRTTFHATVPPDDETLQAVVRYIQYLGYHRIAILTEGNTAYGQNLTRKFVRGGPDGGQTQPGRRDSQHVPEILSLPFPLHISRLRMASDTERLQQEQSRAGSGGAGPPPAAIVPEDTGEPREVLPSFSNRSVSSAELMLSNLLSTIAREGYNYVGIVATDVRDATFLAREVRDHCPATVLFTINSDLLYAQREVNDMTRGMIIITPYPLFNLEQTWTYAYRGRETRLQFSSQAGEGVYNATLALLQQYGQMVDYGYPLPGAAVGQEPERAKPALWVTAVGNGETLPVTLLGWNDGGGYTFSPASGSEDEKRQLTDARTSNIGQGIYTEDSVVVFVILSLLLSVFSLLMVSQYQSPQKGKRGNGISVLLGDPASPSYSSECRLFLLCCSASLLAFYMIVAAAFCLPIIAGKELGLSVQPTITPQIAILLSIGTLLLLLGATHALTAAFRASPSEQRGSAPEVVLVVLLGCAFVFTLAAVLVGSWLAAVRKYPVNGLFDYLRSFDLAGGLSPLLPLGCVATAAFLWALCAFRRLRLIDILRANRTPEDAPRWLDFLPLDTPSFSGVWELEDKVKYMLESSSVMALKWYTSLLAVALLAGHYFFDTRLVRALEPRPFYWLFEAAFFIVYWALLMDFLRLVLTWRNLHLLLKRLSWHPMRAAYQRYRERFPGLARMNLTHPPSSFAALESSVSQATCLLRTARTLLQAADTETGLREICQHSITEGANHVLVAQTQLSEAFRLQWLGDSQAHPTPEAQPTRKKRAIHTTGDWRQALESCGHAQRALSQFVSALGKPMEGYWALNQSTIASLNLTPGGKEFFDQAEEFIAGRVVNLLAIVFPSLRNLGFFVLAGLLLMLLAVTSYPFQPRNEFLFFNWVVILVFVGSVGLIFVQMDRDTILSLLNGTTPGQVNVSRELVIRTLLYVVVPLLALVGAQFPESLRRVLSLFTAAQGSP
ncbi:MAG: hypothetical protein LAP13_00665 [Acidobacteriia bacterium]|nr:hypothetical protein [Terriglobia bacterium]